MSRNTKLKETANTAADRISSKAPGNNNVPNLTGGTLAGIHTENGTELKSQVQMHGAGKIHFHESTCAQGLGGFSRL